MEKLMTPQQLAELIGVKVSTIYSWTNDRKIPRVPGLRLLRFRPSEIEKWLSGEGVRRAEKPVETRSAPRTARRSSRRAEVDKRVEEIVRKVKGGL